jgi:hypothetical protein
MAAEAEILEALDFSTKMLSSAEDLIDDTTMSIAKVLMVTALLGTLSSFSSVRNGS